MIDDPAPSAHVEAAGDSAPPFVRGLDLVMFGLLMAIPWSALIVSEEFYFPFVTPRTYVFRLTVQALVLGCAVMVACDRRRIPRLSPVLLAYLGLAAIALVADLACEQPVRSLVGDLERMGGFATTVHLAALFVVTVTVLRSPKRWHLVFASSLVASAAAATLAFLQAFNVLPLEHISGRVDGGLGNPIYLAGYLLAHVFAAGYLLAARRPPWPLALSLVSIACLDAGAIVVTGTRSALLALVVGAVVFLVAGIRQRLRLRAIAGIVVLVAVVFGFGITAFPLDVKTGFEPVDRVLNSSLSETTIHSRLLVWQIAIEGFVDRPLIGWGEEGFLALFHRHYSPGLWFQSNQLFDRPHSAPLQWLTAAGLLGLLAYLVVFAGAVVGIRMARIDRTLAAILGAWLAAHFTHTLFVFDDLTGAMVFVFLLGLIHTLDKSKKADADRGRAIPFAAAAGAIALVAFAVNSTVIEPARAERLLVAGVRALAKDPALGMESFEAAAAASPVVAPFACDRLLVTVSALVERPEITDESRRRLAGAAREVVQRHLERVPIDLRRRLLLARFLHRTGDTGAAVSHLLIARVLAPNRPDVHLALANAELSTRSNCVRTGVGADRLSPRTREPENPHRTGLGRALQRPGRARQTPPEAGLRYQIRDRRALHRRPRRHRRLQRVGGDGRPNPQDEDRAARENRRRRGPRDSPRRRSPAGVARAGRHRRRQNLRSRPMKRPAPEIDPPPMIASPELRWLMLRAFGPAGAFWAPQILDDDHSANVAVRLDIAARIGSRFAAEEIGREAGPVTAAVVVEARDEAAVQIACLQRLLDEVSSAAAELGMPVVVLKGMAYQLNRSLAPGSRPTGDLDLLAPAAHAQELFDPACGPRVSAGLRTEAPTTTSRCCSTRTGWCWRSTLRSLTSRPKTASRSTSIS